MRRLLRGSPHVVLPSTKEGSAVYDLEKAEMPRGSVECRALPMFAFCESGEKINIEPKHFVLVPNCQHDGETLSSVPSHVLRTPCAYRSHYPLAKKITKPQRAKPQNSRTAESQKLDQPSCIDFYYYSSSVSVYIILCTWGGKLCLLPSLPTPYPSSHPPPRNFYTTKPLPFLCSSHLVIGVGSS